MKPKATAHRRALFLDRDGTLIVDKHYLGDPGKVELLPGIPEALARARELGYRLFLFTNQSGIRRGYFTAGQVDAVNARMTALIGLGPDLFDRVCVAPEGPGDPVVYRKPSPRFIQEMIAEFGLDPAQCWMVGDAAADILAGMQAGVRVAVVRTGRNDAALLPEAAEHAVPLFPSLAEFVRGL